MTELDLMWELLAQAPAALPDMRLFRRSVVNVEAKRGFRVKAGIPGQCDIYAIQKGGRIYEIETKARRGALSPAQKQWQSFCLSWHIPHLVLSERAHETPEVTVARWIEEIEALVRNAPSDFELAALSKDQTA